MSWGRISALKAAPSPIIARRVGGMQDGGFQDRHDKTLFGPLSVPPAAIQTDARHTIHHIRSRWRKMCLSILLKRVEMPCRRVTRRNLCLMCCCPKPSPSTRSVPPLLENRDSIPTRWRSSRGLPSAEMEPAREELTARIIWAGHILSYLTTHRNNIRLQELHEEEQEFDDDAATGRIDCLSGSENSIRFQFLDCVAQLLSPSKGWEYVTATALREREHFVEVDVARNDCFGALRGDWSAGAASDPGGAEEEYFRKLETYMAAVAQQGEGDKPSIFPGRSLTVCCRCPRKSNHSTFG